MPDRHRRGFLPACAVVAAMLVPALGATTASASRTFGSDLTEPISASAQTGCISAPPCTVLLGSVRAGNAFPLASPISGVVVSFGIKTSNAESVTFRLGRIGSLGMGLPGIGAGTGPTANLTAAGSYSIPARLVVQAGDVPGFDYSTNYSGAANLGDGGVVYYAPPLANNASPQAPVANGSTGKLVNAVVEPDVDHDVFGDESQDNCVGTPGEINGCPSTLAINGVSQSGKTVVVTATVPGQGKVNAGAANDPTVLAATAKKKTIQLTPASQTVTAKTNQQLRLTLALTKAAKKKLKKKKGKLGVGVKVTYTPTGGPTGSQFSQLKLKAKKKRKR